MTPSAKELTQLRADLDQGLSLPAEWYTDPAIYQIERDHIFRRTWQWVGRAEEVAAPGDYFTAVLGDIPIVVVRSESGIVSYVNICRHRRHEVMSGAGNRRSLQCPYHAWTYGLDGCLRSAPRTEQEPNFRQEDYPLLPVQVAAWGPWVFASADPRTPPLEHFLGGLPAAIGADLDLGRLVYYQRAAWSRSANWKVMLENFLECYHCPVQHPTFSALIDVRPEAYDRQEHPWHSSQFAPVRETPGAAARGATGAYDARGELGRAQFHFLWPNFTISVNPGHPNLHLDVWIPDGPERTRGISETYFAPGVPDDYARDLIAFNAQVSAEDDRLTDSVQRGVRAGLPIRGRTLARTEPLVLHFQRLLLDSLIDGVD